MSEYQDSNISVSAAGVTAKYSGKQMAEFIALFLVIVVGILGAVLYVHAADVRTSDTLVIQQMKALESKQQNTIDAVNANTTAIKELIYVIALPQEKRGELRLDMPDSLRDRVRR